MGLFSGITKVLTKGIGALIPGVDKAVGLAQSAMSGGISDLINGGLSYLGGQQANEANSAQAARQMQFQQYNSDTAYQRAMADMRAAGLNPMLAYQQGGASTPAGASAVMKDALTPAINTALSSKKIGAEVDNLTATNANIKSTTELNKSLETKAKADALLSGNSARKAALDAQRISAELPAITAKANAESSWSARQLNHIDRFLDTAARFIPTGSSAKHIYHHNQ